MFMMGIGEYLIVMTMMSAMSGGGMLMGMPPAQPDPVLEKCAPAQAVIYAEWSARSKGKEGAKGIDGFVADPEMVTFFKDLDKAIPNYIKKEEMQPMQRILALNGYLLFKQFVNRPGCLYLSLSKNFHPELKKIVKAGQGKGNIEDAIAQLVLKETKIGMVINAGADADKTEKQIKAMLQTLPILLKKGAFNYQAIPLPFLPGNGSLILHRHKNYFILGLDRKTVDQAVAGLTGKSRGLQANKRYVAAKKQNSYKRTASFQWLDIKPVIEVVKVVGKLEMPHIEKIIEAFGGNSLDNVSMVAGVVNGEIRSKTFLTTNGKIKGLLAVASGRAIKPKDLEHIPANSDLCMTVSLDTKKLFTTLKTLVNIIDPGSLKELEKTIKGLEKGVGVRLEQDLFVALGDVWTIHDSKSAGGFFFTSAVASIEIRDSKKANDIFARVVDFIEESLVPKDDGELPDEFDDFNLHPQLRSREFMGETIYYMKGFSRHLPISPVFCLTKTHFLAAMHPQSIKSHLRFLKSKEQNMGKRYSKALTSASGEVVAFNSFDVPRAMRMYYAILSFWAPMVANEIGGGNYFDDFDVFSLPSARAIFPYFGESIGIVSRTKNGIVTETHGLSPMPTVGTLGIPALLWLFTASFPQPQPQVLRGPVQIQRVVPVQKIPVQQKVVKSVEVKDAPIKTKDEKKTEPKKSAEKKTRAIETRNEKTIKQTVQFFRVLQSRFSNHLRVIEKREREKSERKKQTKTLQKDVRKNIQTIRLKSETGLSFKKSSAL